MDKDKLTSLGLSDNQIAAILQIQAGLEKELAQLRQSSLEASQLRDAIHARDQQIETLKAFEGDKKELQKRVAQLQADNLAEAEKFKKALLDAKKDFAVRQALIASKRKPNDLEIVMSQIDMSRIFVDENGVITGLSDQQQRLEAEKSFLFMPAAEKAEQAPKIQGFKVQSAADVPHVQQIKEQSEQKQKSAAADFGKQLALSILQSEGRLKGE